MIALALRLCGSGCYNPTLGYRNIILQYFCEITLHHSAKCISNIK